jgi:hypothetical protein
VQSEYRDAQKVLQQVRKDLSGLRKGHMQLHVDHVGLTERYILQEKMLELASARTEMAERTKANDAHEIAQLQAGVQHVHTMHAAEVEHVGMLGIQHRVRLPSLMRVVVCMCMLLRLAAFHARAAPCAWPGASVHGL